MFNKPKISIIIPVFNCENLVTFTLNSLLNQDNYRYHHVSNIPMHYVIDTYVQTNNIDFEVFIIQKTSFLERLFSGSPIGYIFEGALIFPSKIQSLFKKTISPFFCFFYKFPQENF